MGNLLLLEQLIGGSVKNYENTENAKARNQFSLIIPIVQRIDKILRFETVMLNVRLQ